MYCTPNEINKGSLQGKKHSCRLFVLHLISNKHSGNDSGLQSVNITRDRLILMFEARVQICVAVLYFGCEIQNSSARNIILAIFILKDNNYQIFRCMVKKVFFFFFQGNKSYKRGFRMFISVLQLQVTP